MTTSDINVKQLIINKLTKEQYEAAAQAGLIQDNELYMVTDENYPSYEDLTNGYQPLINETNKLNVNYINGLANVAVSGEYSDIKNAPTIPASQVQVDWNETNTSSVSYIINKPTIPEGITVDQVYNALSINAQSGTAVANAIANKVDITSLANVATSGEYSDLLNIPTWSYNATSETLSLL